MNVNNFIDSFSGGARTNLFEALIDFPDVVRSKVIINQATTLGIISTQGALQTLISGSSPEATAKLIGEPAYTTAINTTELLAGGFGRLSCKNAKLPNSVIKSIDMQYKGLNVAIPANRSDDKELSLTFYNDMNFIHRNAFEIWSQMIRTTISNIGYYPTHVMGSGKVYQHDSFGNIIKTYKFINLFPKSVSDITLDWDSEGLETFTVSFSFSYWESDTNVLY